MYVKFGITLEEPPNLQISKYTLQVTVGIVFWRQ